MNELHTPRPETFENVVAESQTVSYIIKAPNGDYVTTMRHTSINFHDARTFGSLDKAISVADELAADLRSSGVTEDGAVFAVVQLTRRVIITDYEIVGYSS